MKQSTMMISLAIAASLAAIAGYQFGTRHAQPVQAAAAPAPQEKKVLYWHDPMVPGQKFDKPGKSPFMDMQLVPVYADDSVKDNGVRIDPRIQQNLGIRTATAEMGRLAAPLAAVGTVAYNERDVVLVQARANGYIERLHVRAPLDPVRQGQALADVYMPDWVAAQEEYLAVRHMVGADSLLDAARQRMRLAGMSDAQIQLVDSSGKLHPRLTITAPASGVVTELNAREGMTVAAGAPLFRINGTATVWIEAEIPEQAAAQVRAGVPVEAHAAALPGVTFKGNVSALLPELNPATRTIKARIELANSSRRLTPGMFVNVSLHSAAGSDMLLIPSEAVIRTGTRTIVMVMQEGGGFAPAEVEAGAEADGKTEIRSGLHTGDKVVVSGQFLIDSDASLHGTAMRMDGARP
ncbi:efflux RND transporter periplasmic adaptor subunit [Pseudoduganella sp. FT26W]|uniref:Efflux RND transporter periplasmic adaptor subunit n=1 Tax=Duganella aquatilis TaxID=2666082 RepID=A0A844D623_9BURK|nr:efflux RND transporter periplasmic adaptor subunit [Duganella aquatilis]MRW84092.1 efflux RND transporter periplasmic adaptor subunit [Duganella aquatilis]